MDIIGTLILPLDHPCYAGHFLGNAVVPGVLLLEFVVDALARGAPRGIISAKFHRVIKPGESVELSVQASGERLSFRCTREDVLLAEGILDYAQAAPPA